MMCVNGVSLTRAASATLHCGDVMTGDMLALFDHSIGKVVSFWQSSDSTISVELEMHRQIPNEKLVFESQSNRVAFVDARLIIEPLFWYRKSNSILAVMPDHGIVSRI